MAAGTPNLSWKDTLAEIEGQREVAPTFSQVQVFESICNFINAENILGPSIQSLDTKDPEVIGALKLIYDTGLIHGGLFGIPWFCTFISDEEADASASKSASEHFAEALKVQKNIRGLLLKVCSDFIKPGGFEANVDKPKVLVPMWMAAAIASWTTLYGAADIDTSEAAVTERKMLAMTCEDAILSLTPRNKSKCDQYVTSLFGFPHNAETLINTLMIINTSLNCAILATDAEFNVKTRLLPMRSCPLFLRKVV